MIEKIKKPKIRVSSAKAKARRLQDLVRDKIRSLFNLSDNDVKSAIMGESGIDIKLSDNARNVLPYGIECKARAKISLYKDWEQAKINADKEGLQPLLIIKADRKEPLTILLLDSFLEIIKNEQ